MFFVLTVVIDIIVIDINRLKELGFGDSWPYRNNLTDWRVQIVMELKLVSLYSYIN